MRSRKILVPVFLLALILSTCDTGRGLVVENAMVVSAHPLASEAGLEILKKGGNAIDAAIAIQFALAVVYPIAGNIGGGGFMVIRLSDGTSYSLDYREKAPLNASRDMYLDDSGKVIKEASKKGHLASGVPGTVEGMVTAFERFGSLNWDELVQPAIDLAKYGFPLTERQAENLNKYQEDFLTANTVSPDFLKKDQWEAGDSIMMKNLAETLEQIKNSGRSGFYEGKTANLIIEEIKRGGGIMTHQDLGIYKAIWRDPIKEELGDFMIISMGPPSSGGIALVQLLKMVSPYLKKDMNWHSTEYIHLLTEAEKRVYADRAEHLGDIDFYPVPQATLLSDEYNKKRMENFDPLHLTPADKIQAGEINIYESSETTHFSIVDEKGNAVSVTTTLNGAYGSKVIVAGAGFFLNNEMDDFSVKPGYPNMFGLIGGEANAIEPEKRMLSSMTPTILEKNGDLFMVLGSPGGSKIITSVFQAILNVIHFEYSMQKSVDLPRFHHQWKPDTLYYEPDRFTKETKEKLKDMDYHIKEISSMGRVDAILVPENDLLEGGADTRGDDMAAGY